MITLFIASPASSFSPARALAGVGYRAPVLALAIVSAVLATSLPCNASAQTVTGAELGRHEFETNCAICHGIDARGGGPMRPFLARVPTDLTSLARRNGGVFPKDAVAELIDGRATVEPGPHGTREMPIWGNVYREQANHQMRGMPFPSEWSVRGRILALTDYLSTLQQR
ncbi:MAG: cytochrome c [Burkholderiales bacterium]|nr:cytochrome c [Burkholderiales bacterium]